MLTLARFFTALFLALWVGGMAFFGIMAAPVLFHPERSGIARPSDMATLAPQLVSAMLSRFGVLTTICGVLLLACWFFDGVFSGSLRSRLWRSQGVLSLFCLGFSLFLNRVLLPQTRAQQAQILPIIARAAQNQTLSSAEKSQRAAFDAGHKRYQQLATINLYLVMATLLVLMARGTGPNRENREQ